MTDDPRDKKPFKSADILSLDFEKKAKKRRDTLNGVPATKADLEYIVDRLVLIQEDQDRLEKLFLRLLRLLKKDGIDL